jgi:hypothetical protein
MSWITSHSVISFQLNGLASSSQVSGPEIQWRYLGHCRAQTYYKLQSQYGPIIDSFLKSLLGAADVSEPSSSKRSRESSANSDDSSDSKKAKTSPVPSLKKSTNLQWGGPRFSMRAPTTPNVEKCIDKWDLLAPFDTTITDKQCKEYFEERTAVENLNTPWHRRVQAIEVRRDYVEAREDAPQGWG